MPTDVAVVILAAGMGTRMNSKRQKILHEVGGLPMVSHVWQAAGQLTSQRPVLVVGHGADELKKLMGDKAHYATQAEQLGTGHATLMARELLTGRAKQVLVTCADMPLVRAETLQKLVDTQAQTGAKVVVLSVTGEPTTSFGRIVRDKTGRVTEILEVAQAKTRPNAADLLAITEQNAGAYCFEAQWLWETLTHLPQRVARNGNVEYYLTDTIEMAVTSGELVEAYLTPDRDESLGAGTRAEMVAVEKAFRQRAVRRWLDAGVTIIDPAATYIDQTVTIGQDTVIWPNTYLQGQTVIGADCHIGPNTILRETIVGDGCKIEQAVVEKIQLPAGSNVLPFTHLHPQEVSYE